jgi:hypothetical protein
MARGLRIAIERCAFHGFGGTAVTVEGQEVAVRHSRLSTLGAGGVALAGGDRATLVPARHRVEHCLFEDFGRLVRTYAPGVRLSGVGSTVTGCLFRRAPHSAILFGGNEHAIAGNEIHSVLMETGDCGAIYGGRDWTSFGTVISGNWIHDLGGHAGRWACGIYLDDQLSGITVRGNWVDRAELGLLIGGGRHNLVADNIISRCRQGISADARGTTWGREKLLPTLFERLSRIPVDREPWKSRYPMLAGLREDRPEEPVGTRIVSNALVACGVAWLHRAEAGGMVTAPNFEGLPEQSLVVTGRSVTVQGTPLRFVKPGIQSPRHDEPK